MSIVIIGGKQNLVSKYKDLCESYHCNAKVFVEVKGNLKDKVGRPDLMVLFTNTMSHKMMRCALSELKGCDTIVAKCPSSSMSALKTLLNNHIA